MGKALRRGCRYPCYSTFGKWVGDGMQELEILGCDEVVRSVCLAPLIRGEVGIGAVVKSWVRRWEDGYRERVRLGRGVRRI